MAMTNRINCSNNSKNQDITKAAVQSGSLKRVMRILVAEDDEEMRNLLAFVLRKDGYGVIEATNGEELIDFLGLSLLDKSLCDSVDLIISDIRMPGYSGLEALAGLRAAGCTVPFILITAFGSEEIHKQAHDLGAAAVFDKPFNMDDLRTVVLNIVPPDHFPREIPHLPRPVRIFLAEDDLEMLKLLSTTLKKDGFEVIEIKDGTRLVDTLATELINSVATDSQDIIISDIRMPGWSGMDVLSGIRKAGWKIPVILITAFGDSDTHRKANELGATAIFDKPFNIEDFRTVVLYVALRLLAKLPGATNI